MRRCTRFAAAIIYAGVVLMAPAWHQDEARPQAEPSCQVQAGSGLAWQVGCDGCPDPSHHHHGRPIHDPHHCPTCHALGQPAVVEAAVADIRVPQAVFRSLPDQTVQLVLRPNLLPPLRAPPRTLVL